MEDVKSMLVEEKEKILKHIDEQLRPDTDHDVGDDIDSSVDSQGRELMFILRDRDRIKLEQIEDALARIEKGEYGDCDECGEAIGEKRLMIVPFAKLCLTCQSAQERVRGKSLISFNDDSGYMDSGN